MFEPPKYSKPEPCARGEKPGSYPEVVFRYANGVKLRLADGPPGGAVFVCERGRISIDRSYFKLNSSSSQKELRGQVDMTPEPGNEHLKIYSSAIKSPTFQWRMWKSDIVQPPFAIWATSLAKRSKANPGPSH